MLKLYQISENKIVESVEPNSSILLFTNPDENEKKYLINELKLDEHTLASALDPDELSRLEFEPEHLAIIFKRPKNYSSKDEFLFKVVSTGIFLFKDRLIIILPEQVTLFDGKIFVKVQTLEELMLKIIYRSIFHFLEHLKVITMITDELEQKTSESMKNRYLLNLFTLEKSLVYYLNAISSNGITIERLRIHYAKTNHSSQEQLEFIDDLLIENNQCYKQSEIYSNILASLMDARVSIVSNNLNYLMKTLTLITLCIMVPTLIVSIFSMNVTIPLAHNSYAFWVIMALAGISVLIFLLIFRHKKW